MSYPLDYRRSKNEPILVPATYGHYVETFAQVFPTLTTFLTSMGADVSNGSVQVQVAP